MLPMMMIWHALDFPNPSACFKYPEHIHIMHRKFSKALWSWRKVVRSQNILHNFSRLVPYNIFYVSNDHDLTCVGFSCSQRMFKYPEHIHIMHKKFFKALWRWRKSVRSQNILHDFELHFYKIDNFSRLMS